MSARCGKKAIARDNISISARRVQCMGPDIFLSTFARRAECNPGAVVCEADGKGLEIVIMDPDGWIFGHIREKG